MANFRTNSVSRKRNAKKSTIQKCAVHFHAEFTEWSIDGATHTGTRLDWLSIADGNDWYTTDLHIHAPHIDALLAGSGAIARHFEAGTTTIAILCFPFADGTPLDELKQSYRVINASYLLSGKTLEQWAEITTANAPTVTAQLLQIIASLDLTMMEHFGCSLAMTIPSTAIEAWKRCIPTGEKYNRQHKDVEALARAAFFGGWNFADVSRIHGDGVYFDANSLYAFIMRSKGVPSGRAIVASGYEAGDVGIYSVRISGLYEGMLNPVSCRVGFEVVHPFCEDEHDSFVTEMTSVDIELCKRLGIGVKVLSGYCFDGMCFPFGEFVDKCETLRNSSARGTPLNAMARVLQASLFGKFGASAVNKEIMITSRDLSEIGYSRIDGTITMNSPDQDTSGYSRWVKDVESTSGTIHPHWAAFITAHARAYLFDALLVAGQENLIYAATDSLILKPEGAQRLLSSDYCKDLSVYGQFKVVHRFLSFRAFASNRYAGEGVDSDGVPYYFGASSGLPLMPDTDYDKLYQSWLSPEIKTDEQALIVASRVFTIPREAVDRALRLKAMQERARKNKATQTRTEMFGANPNRKIDKW